MEAKHNFSLNLIFLLALNLLVKPFYLFGIEVDVQNTVGASDYGLYYAMFNFTFLFNVLLDLGINNYQKIKVSQDAKSGMQNMATLLPMKLLLSAMYMLITVIVAWIIGFEGRYWFFIGWLMVNHVLSVFLLMLRANLSGLHLFIRDSILSVTDRLILILAIGYLLWFRDGSFSIEQFVLWQTAAYSLTIVLALALTPKGQRLISPRFSWSGILSMTKQTWPFALLILLMTAYNKLDGIMLERLADNGTLEAGIYAQAFRILDAGNSFAFLYAGLLLPIFARLLRQNNSLSEINALVDLASRMLIVPAGIVFITCFQYSDWIMELLYDEHASKSALSLTWLMGSFVFIACGYVFGTLITAGSDLRLLNWISFITVLLNVVMNFAVIPTMGAEGAAMTSFASLAFMALSQIIFAIRKHKLTLTAMMVRTLITWVAAFAVLQSVTLIFDGVALQIGFALLVIIAIYFRLVLPPKAMFDRDLLKR
ncbi:MAG: oligosaccharide flippase family protein [Salibacteraceae bacterium]